MIGVYKEFDSHPSCFYRLTDCLRWIRRNLLFTLIQNKTTKSGHLSAISPELFSRDNATHNQVIVQLIQLFILLQHSVTVRLWVKTAPTMQNGKMEWFLLPYWPGNYPLIWIYGLAISPQYNADPGASLIEFWHHKKGTVSVNSCHSPKWWNEVANNALASDIIHQEELPFYISTDNCIINTPPQIIPFRNAEKTTSSRHAFLL